MKAISSADLERLENHLHNKAFTYEETYNEVLDHYASACEQSDQPTETVIAQMDEEFTNNKIQKIEQKYFNDLTKSLRHNHWLLFTGNFKYPQILYTILCAGLLVISSPILMKYEWLVKTIYIIIALIPIVFGCYFYFKWVARKWMKKTRLKNAHAELFGIGICFSTCYAQLPTLTKIFISEEFRLLQHHPLLTASILFFGVILLTGSVKLVNTKIRPAI